MPAEEYRQYQIWAVRPLLLLNTVTVNAKETGDSFSGAVAADLEMKAQAQVSISELKVQNMCNVTITEREY